jgi:hypothetical protein
MEELAVLFSQSPSPGVPSGPVLILLSSLLLAAFTAGITTINLMRKHISLLRRMGGGTWSFQQSWGSNVTFAAGLLGALSTLTFPPHAQLMEKSSYALLQALFLSIAGLAPLLYGLIHRNVPADTGGLIGVDSQGYVIMFLVAGTFVLWAAFGQLITLAVLIAEYRHSESIGTGVARTLFFLIGFLGVLLLLYGFRSLYGTAKNMSSAEDYPRSTQPHLVGTPAASLTGPGTPLRKSLAEWPLL